MSQRSKHSSPDATFDDECLPNLSKTQQDKEQKHSNVVHIKDAESFRGNL